MFRRSLIKRLFSVSSKMLQFPAAERNKDPIRQVLQRYFPLGTSGTALEIACGNGAHITYFAQMFKNLVWQPSDVNEKLFTSVTAYIDHMDTENVLKPIKIDVTTPPEEWKDAFGKMKANSFDLMYNANMIHISPWDTALGLFRGAKYLIKPGGKLFLYGPFAVHGQLTPESNIQFDKRLRQENSSWGIRDVDDVQKLAQEANMTLVQTVEMPANNKILIFQKDG